MLISDLSSYVFSSDRVVTAYGARPEGSVSKLSTYRDGWRILRTILTLYRIERPILLFGIIAALLESTGLVLAAPLIVTYMKTGGRKRVVEGKSVYIRLDVGGLS